MGLFRVELWHLGCDYLDPVSGRRCSQMRTERGVPRDGAIAAARLVGWSVSRRPGRFDVRCPDHKGLRTPNPGVARGSLRPNPKGRAEAGPSPTPPTDAPRLKTAGSASAARLQETRPDRGAERPRESDRQTDPLAAGGHAERTRDGAEAAERRRSRPARNARRHGRPRGSGAR